MMVYPLVKMGVIATDYPVFVTALSGYSGAGKKNLGFSVLFIDSVEVKDSISVTILFGSLIQHP